MYLNTQSLIRASLAVTLALTGLLAAPARTPAATTATAVNVTATTGDGLKKAVQAYKGKVVVVNLWATWCEPCVEEYPDLLKLYNNYKSKGVVLVSVSMDEPEDKGKVVAFAKKVNAACPIFLRAKGSMESFMNPLDKKWSGAVPTTYVFDKQGKQVGPTITSKQSYAQFEAALKPALK